MILPTLPPFNHTVAKAARQRQDTLTKPIGALGRLEELSIQLAGITGEVRPRFKNKAVIIMAGDHGIAQEGISAYPSAVTEQMVLNFLRGGAAVNVLARQAGARVAVVDIGVAADFSAAPGLYRRKVTYGTANMLKAPAMTRLQTETAIQVGLDIVQAEVALGLDLVATGEMGIGNTTPSTALTAVFGGAQVAEVAGRGTGLDDAGLQRKIQTIEAVLAFHRPDPNDPLDVLSKVGGLEIAGLVGVILGAASRRIPVVIDGFISGAAALTAVQLEPKVKPFLIASHLSVERGHRVIWERIGMKPLINLDLRLGEGTGAVLAFHLIEAAARIIDEMATFTEAGVSGQE